jgi:hypothetical protein
MLRLISILVVTIMLGDKVYSQTQTNYLDSVYTFSYFENIFGANGSCLPLSDTSYIISTTAATWSGNHAPMLFAINLKGDTLWTKYYEDTLIGVELNCDAVYDHNKNIIIAGDFRVDSIANGLQAMLMKIDPRGNLQWLRTFGISTYSYWRGVTGLVAIATNDNHYLCVGQLGIDSPSLGIDSTNSYILVIRTDTAGNEMSRWQYGNRQYSIPNAGIETSDSSALIVGATLSSNTPYSGGFSIYILKIDNNGNLLWDSIYSAPIGVDSAPMGTQYYLLSDAEANGVIEDTDGYVVCGHRFARQNFVPHGSPAAFQKAWIAKLNKQTGGLIWEKNIGIDNATYQRFYSIIKTRDGGYATVGGWINADQTTGDCWLVKTDINGDSLWSRKYLYANDDSLTTAFYNILQTKDNGYILTGHCEPNDTYSYPWVVITDSMGCLIPGCDTLNATAIKERPDEFVGMVVYPNPASGVAYLLIKSDNNIANLSFKIFDLNGKLISTQNHATTDVTYIINTGNLAKGMYLIEVTSDGKVLAARKLIKD